MIATDAELFRLCVLAFKEIACRPRAFDVSHRILVFARFTMLHWLASLPVHIDDYPSQPAVEEIVVFTTHNIRIRRLGNPQAGSVNDQLRIRNFGDFVDYVAPSISVNPDDENRGAILRAMAENIPSPWKVKRELLQARDVFMAVVDAM